jgi:hypothetical protein
MDNAAGWQPDPEREDQERYWSGSEWTDRVRPAGKARSLHLPEHVPELQRALAAATADIDAVEDRLSNLFDRTEGKSPGSVPETPPTSKPPPASAANADPDDDEIIDLLDESDDVDDDEDPIHEEFAGPTDLGGDREGDGADEDEDEDDGAFAELDAALAAEQPEDSKRRFFRRRS